MPLHQSPTFTATKFFYAVAFDAAYLPHGRRYDSLGMGTSVYVPALWFKRKQGRLVVSKGYFFTSFRDAADDMDVLRAETEQDMRTNLQTAYAGGTVEATWDGQKLWTVHPVDFDMAANLKAELEQIRQRFEADAVQTPPPGYSGWFSTKE